MSQRTRKLSEKTSQAQHRQVRHQPHIKTLRPSVMETQKKQKTCEFENRITKKESEIQKKFSSEFETTKYEKKDQSEKIRKPRFGTEY